MVTGRLTDLERDLAIELLENSRNLFLACLRAVTPAQWSRNEPKGRWSGREELERAFADRRARTLEFVRATDAALHHHFAPLGPLGDLDAYQWILLVASHTERHVRQIEEILAG